MSGFNPSAWAVAHRPLVLFFILAVAAAGALSYVKLGRAEDPSFTIKVMVFTARWPGATAAEVQDQVAERVEKKLQELPHVDRVETYTRPGFMAVQLKLRDDTPPNEVPDLWYQARKKISDIKPTLPDGVLGPQADDEYGDVYSGVYYFTGDGLTPADLKRLAEDARHRFLRLPGVSKVALVGDRPEKVFVEFSHAKLATLGVTPHQLFESLARQNAVTPAGSVDTAHDRVFVRVEGALDAAARVRDVPVEAGGKLFRLGDVAEVRRGYEDPPEFTVRHNGQPAVGLSVAMAPGGNVIDLGKALRAEADAIRADLPAGAEMHEAAFQPHVVDESVSEFVKSFVEALAIVLAVSFLTLGFRTGVVVALSVPLVLAICFVVMRATGINLDRITLGALIIALGLQVDDAIIAVEMMVVKMEEGWDRVQAATYAWTSTAKPMLTGTLITAAGFLPVGFAQSSSGEYAGAIFWVVGLALVVSWFVAVVFTPYLGVKLLPDFQPHGGAHGHQHDPYQSRFYRVLRKGIEACVRRPWAVAAVTLGLFAAAVVGFGHVKKQFFPQSARPELLVDLQLPEGSSFRAADGEVAKVEALLKDDPDVRSFSAYTGAGSPRFYLSLNPDLPDPSFAKLVVVARDTEARERVVAKLRGAFAGGEFPNARGRVSRLDMGPPVGFPVQFRVVGPDPAVARRIAEDVRAVVRKHPDTRDTEIDWGETVRSVKLKVDQDRARSLGLTPQDVSETLQSLLTGVTVTQYREGTELIDVVARAVPGERLDLGSLPDVNLPSRRGAPVPLAQVAIASVSQEPPILRRWNREPTVIVRADVVDGVQPPDVTAALLPQLQPIRDGLPPGYRIDTGGSAEESGKANASLFAVLPVMVLAMLTLLMTQLQDFRKALLVFLISPRVLIGVTAALLAFDAPFGFVALLGVLSLIGMDMRNSVILVDQIAHDLDAGASPWEAVIGATVRRARPVVLTSSAAILAMIPLTHSVFWGPMAIAIMGGLAVATVLTLITLPSLYVILFGVKPPAAPAASAPAAKPTAPPRANRRRELRLQEPYPYLEDRMMAATAPKKRIVILGGGFGGVSTAYHLERLLRGRPDVEIVLVSRDNFVLMTPLLFEVFSGVLDVRGCSVPIRAFLRSTRFVEAAVEGIDLDRRVVRLGEGRELGYDQLILALGSRTNRGLIPGSEHAFTFKTLADALVLRNHVIERFERADAETDPRRKARQLTFVIAGGGLVGVELLGELTAFADGIAPHYPNVDRGAVRFFLLQGGDRIMPEIDPRLADYGARVLAGRRGVELRTRTRVRAIEPGKVHLPDEVIAADTIVLAAGTVPDPVVAGLPAERDAHGRVVVEPTMRCASHPEVWALGDCAAIPGPDGRPYPGLAQHALRAARVLAGNVAGALDGRAPRPFVFRTLGMMGSLGHAKGFGRLLGVRVRGFPAWFLRRAYYLAQMPGWGRKLRIVADWTLALLFRPDVIKLGLDSETAQLVCEVAPGDAAAWHADARVARTSPAADGPLAHAR